MAATVKIMATGRTTTEEAMEVANLVAREEEAVNSPPTAVTTQCQSSLAIWANWTSAALKTASAAWV